jgi:hypothetical protein
VAGFDLTANPFWLLGTSIRARQREVIDALEIAVSNGVTPEPELIRAQQLILAPRTRLESELSWLPELTPARAGTIVAMLAANPPKEIAIPLLDGLEGISRVNLAADICRRYPGHVDLVDQLAKSYEGLCLDDIETSINASRSVAGFSPVDRAVLKASLTKTENAHAEAATICLAASPSPGRALSQLIVGTVEPDSLHFEFLDTTIRSYRTWAGTRLRQIDDALQKEIDSMKGSPGDLGISRNISAGIGLWSEWNGPVEIWDQAKGLEEPRSYEICDRLRDLSLWLANDMDHHKAALEITEALCSNFANLPSMAKRLEEDAKTLKRLVESESISTLIGALQRAIEGTSASLPTLRSNLLAKGFGSNSAGMAKDLYQPFQLAIAMARGTAHADIPWRLIRGVMIDLNNHDYRDASERLGRDLLALAAGKASNTFMSLLEEDLRTLRNNIRWAQIEGFLKTGHKKQALPLLHALIADQSPGEDLAHFHKLYMKLQGEIETARRGNLERQLKWAAGIIIFIVWIAIKSWPSDGHDKSVQPVASASAPQSETFATSPLPEQPPAASDQPASTSDDDSETEPAIGSGQVLSQGELRYCQFQHARIVRAKALSTTHEEIENVNGAVDAFNARCSHYRYLESDMTKVRSEVENKQADIERDAQALLIGSTNP